MNRKESWKTRLTRWGFNFFPAYRRTGARITFMAGDWRRARVHLPLNWKTRNYVGTMFGGSMFAAVDPIYMVMFIKQLGPNFIVWDKAATIQFKRPGRTTLCADFEIESDDLDSIRREVEARGKVDRVYQIELRDASGAVCAIVQKTLHFKKRGDGVA